MQLSRLFLITGNLLLLYDGSGFILSSLIVSDYSGERDEMNGLNQRERWMEGFSTFLLRKLLLFWNLKQKVSSTKNLLCARPQTEHTIWVEKYSLKYYVQKDSAAASNTANRQHSYLLVDKEREGVMVECSRAGAVPSHWTFLDLHCNTKHSLLLP